MKIKSIISIALVLLCISCSNDEALDNTSSAKKLEVVNLKDFIDANSQTRSISNTNQAVLRFKIPIFVYCMWNQSRYQTSYISLGVLSVFSRYTWLLL